MRGTRLHEKRAARRYWHKISPWNRCGSWRCLRCHWHHIIGEHERQRRLFLIRSNNTRHLVPLLRKGPDGNYHRVDR